MGESMDARNFVGCSFHTSRSSNILTLFPSQNSGQNCIGIERLLVHKSQYDELHEILEKRISILRSGSVLSLSAEGYVSTIDCGSMISRERFQSLQRVIQEAAEGGAKVIGGTECTHGYLENGAYFTPTLVGLAAPHMSIAREERRLSYHPNDLTADQTLSLCSHCCVDEL